MEIFKISSKTKEYEVRTPLLKGDRNIAFQVFENSEFKFALSPQLTKNNKLGWVRTVCDDKLNNDLPELSDIGKAIEAHYRKSDVS